MCEVLGFLQLQRGPKIAGPNCNRTSCSIKLLGEGIFCLHLVDVGEFVLLKEGSLGEVGLGFL